MYYSYYYKRRQECLLFIIFAKPPSFRNRFILVTVLFLKLQLSRGLQANE